MSTLPENRTTGSTPAEHVADHNELHRLHNLLDAERPLVDTAANLSASNPVLVAGRIAHATDTDTLAIGDGSTAYNSLPKYGPERTSVVATTTASASTVTTITDWAGLTVTVECDGVRPLTLEAYCCSVTGTSVGDQARMSIYEDTTLIQLADGHPRNHASNNQLGAIKVEKAFVPSAGSHTYKVRVQRQAGSGSVTFLAGSGFEAHLKAQLG